MSANDHIRRQQKRKPVDLQDGTDPLERKRVLNVLAQRRYRQRRRQEQDAIKALLHAQPADEIPQDIASSWATLSPGSAVASLTATDRTDEQCVIYPQTSTRDPGQGLLTPAGVYDTPNSITSSETSLLEADAEGGVSDSHYDASWQLYATSSDDPTDPNSACAYGLFDESNAFHPNSATVGLSHGSGGYSQAYDPSLDISLDAEMLFRVPELDMLRACNIVADLIHSRTLISSLTALSVFNAPDARTLPWVKTLPLNLRPTNAQYAIPHHPMLDILPWPAVRTRAISLFSLPESEWPRGKDGSTLGMMDFHVDIDDGGVMVRGSNPIAEDAWEVQHEFAEKWWFCLEPKILRAADKWRRQRGELPLKCLGFSGKY